MKTSMRVAGSTVLIVLIAGGLATAFAQAGPSRPGSFQEGKSPTGSPGKPAGAPGMFPDRAGRVDALRNAIDSTLRQYGRGGTLRGQTKRSLPTEALSRVLNYLALIYEQTKETNQEFLGLYARLQPRYAETDCNETLENDLKRLFHLNDQRRDLYLAATQEFLKVLGTNKWPAESLSEIAHRASLTRSRRKTSAEVQEGLSLQSEATQEREIADEFNLWFLNVETLIASLHHPKESDVENDEWNNTANLVEQDARASGRYIGEATHQWASRSKMCAPGGCKPAQLRSPQP
jgi:hypothetical protein